MAEAKLTPFDKITIRVISTGQDQKTKNVFPAIANNKGLMRNMGFVISDPQYDAKMDSIKNKKPFSENGQAKLPAQESFAPITEPVKTEPIVTQPKNEIIAPAITDEPKTRKPRRTKEQIASDKLTASKQTA